MREQRLVLATYRLLGEGEPFRPEGLAERASLPVEEVDSRLEEWMPHGTRSVASSDSWA